MSSMLSAGEIVQMRGEVGRTLPGTAILYSPTKTFNQGDQGISYAAYGTVNARLAPESGANLGGGAEPEVADRIAVVNPWILTLAAETTINENNRVEFNSTTYSVVQCLDWRPWELSKRVRLVKVD